MARAITRLLLINKQLSFTVRMKQALEEIGGYSVSPFTAADTALEHLRDNPHDIAVVDFTLPGMSGEAVVAGLRDIQPDLLIVASPDVPEVNDAVAQLRLSGVVDAPCSAREMMPALEKAMTLGHETLGETAEAPLADNDNETAAIDPMATEFTPKFSSLDSVIITTGGLDPNPGTGTMDLDAGEGEGGELSAQEADLQDSQSIEVILTGGLSELKPSASAIGDDSLETVEAEDEDDDTPVDDVFQKLAADEPPVPSLEENGTVSDLMAGIAKAGFDDVAEAVMQEQSSTAGPSLSDDMTLDEDDEDTPAEKILKAATGDDMLSPESLQDLLQTFEEQFPEDVDGIKPLPSWLAQLERYVREPDFLTEGLPELDQAEEASFQTTQMVDFEEDSDLFDMDTDKMDAVTPQPPPPAADALPPYEFDDEDAQALAEGSDEDTASFTTEERAAHRADFDDYATDPVGDFRPPQPPQPPQPPPAGVPEMTQSTLGLESDDPEIAQLALALTQASLELTAEATLIARDGEIVAYSGKMPIDDVRAVGEALGDDWGAKPGESRIRFISLPGSGKDYMLYSRMADGAYALSMIFAGNMPLRVIRRQSDRLVKALERVPEDSDAAVMESSLIDELHEAERLKRLEEEARLEEQSAVESTQELLATYPDLVEHKPSAPEIDDISDDDTVEHAPSVEEAPAPPIEDIREAPSVEPELAIDDAPELVVEPEPEPPAVEDFAPPVVEDDAPPVIEDFAPPVVDAPAPQLEDDLAEMLDEDTAESEPVVPQAVAPTKLKRVPVEGASLPDSQYVSYTYIWMVRDADKLLTPKIATMLVEELDVQLTLMGWRCNILHVFEDYIYLVADVPADTLSHEILPELKQRSAQIVYGIDASYSPDDLWADSYLVLTPGREMHSDEIQRFISFSRS